MNSDTPLKPPAPPPDRQRPVKFLAALGTLLVLGGTLVASRALYRTDSGTNAPAAAQDGQVPAHTAKAVAAANKFLQGLDDKPRAKATFAFDSDKRPSWSNLPPSFVPRNGP